MIGLRNRDNIFVETPSRNQRTRHLSWFRTFVLLLVVILLGIFGAAALVVADTQNGSDKSLVDAEIEAGTLMYRDGVSGAWFQATTLTGSAQFSVTGLLASVRVTQRFRNESQEWVEAIYLFPLPDTAAVNHMEIHVGDRRIVGQIKEKQNAFTSRQRKRENERP